MSEAGTGATNDGGNAGGRYPGLVDWDLAVATGTRLVRPGPAVTFDEAREIVAELRAHAGEAQAHVRKLTELVADGGGSAVAVIDRPTWIRANAEGFRTALAPLVEKLTSRRDGRSAGAGSAIGARITGVETGSLLAFLAGKVLGQYELFPAYGSGEAVSPGRLLLVAPNIVAAEREMGVDPRDFRLWVCIHEETHRVQFGAVPWLRDHVMNEVRAFLEQTDIDPATLLRRMRAAAGAVSRAVRGDEVAEGTGSLLDAVQTPAQMAILDRLTAVMSLLEGHADYVMDGVGPEVIPSVEAIRAKFQRRRANAGRSEQVLRRLLGVEAKMRQYRDGERFVRNVVEKVGMAGFNRVWTSAETLPSREELADPSAWVRRVHGPDALPA
jgi:coenzyme F420 biosynthesis associated uncharacterized protein